MTTPEVPKNSPAKRLFLVAFVGVMFAAAGYSVWANLARWQNADLANAQMRQAAAANVLDIETSGRTRHRFTIDLANTDAQRAKGLMFRTSMPADYGMLFDFERDQPVSMWMKNTYISLDMLFILKDGTIHRIAERTEPHSERTLSSNGNVRAVLEINGGQAEKLGIKAGDRIYHPMFSK